MPYNKTTDATAGYISKAHKKKLKRLAKAGGVSLRSLLESLIDNA